jgi:hypothetical protein
LHLAGTASARSTLLRLGIRANVHDPDALGPQTAIPFPEVLAAAAGVKLG